MFIYLAVWIIFIFILNYEVIESDNDFKIKKKLLINLEKMLNRLYLILYKKNE